ncbi:MAG: peptide chain release factor N(5)-glutamine methyltransferase [Clostridia bacterium]
MTIAQALAAARERLAAAGIEDAAFEARELAASLCAIPRSRLNLALSDPFNRAEELERLVGRRLSGEPLQYIIGEWEFMSLPFHVGPGVLIPRPETELLAEFAIRQCGDQPFRILDLCAGSGCIGISVANSCPNAHVWLVEKSEQAFSYLMENIRINRVPNVTPILGDIFDPEILPANVRFDLILSNPPYIASGELPGLQREVHWEPSSALDGGADGLDFYRSIALTYPEHIIPGGWIGLEFGDGQAEAVRGIFAPYFADTKIVPDLAGIPRMLFAHK